MKDYMIKKDPNLEALIARYKEPEPTVEPEPEHQASVTFVDAGGKPIPKPETEWCVDVNPNDPYFYPEKRTKNTGFTGWLDKKFPDPVDYRTKEEKTLQKQSNERAIGWFIVIAAGIFILQALGFGGGENCMVGRAMVC